MFCLTALRIDRLAEVPLPTHQGYGNERQSQVSGGAQGIAGEHAQAAGIRWNFTAQRYLHGKIGNARHLEKLTQHGGFLGSDDHSDQHQQYDPDEDNECQMSRVWLHDHFYAPKRAGVPGRS
jgi:hypothetical protein